MIYNLRSFHFKWRLAPTLLLLGGILIVGISVSAKKFSNNYHVPLAPAHEEFFQTIKPYMGQCVLQYFEKRYPRFDAFDKTVVPYWEKTLFSSTSPEAESLRDLLQSYSLEPGDLVAIDALARTLYAEMDRGFDHGLHYGRAIAGVVLNRAHAVDLKKRGYQVFSMGLHKKFHPLKKTITNVVVARRQFSAWDGVIKGKYNPVLSHALCPPINSEIMSWKRFATQYKHIPKKKLMPSKNEVLHWNVALRIAFEAILDPDRFWANFSKLNKRELIAGQDAFPIYYYTSGYYTNGESKGKRVTLFAHRRDGAFKVVQGPAIGGRRDFDERLLRFWAPRNPL
ncbi:MAG: hypothetical protein A4S09_10745 [Proteobacteria bacterium SG_bin7]|nr:MAG: hypothetical protein A4S09_10745 [Proteobacteria bacterium SG_bin7]